MYQTGGTIKETLDKIRDRKFALPAIQREFVWRPDQICRLFDSMMQGYPFGTFLFWQVDAAKTKEYQFYQFMQHYHEKDHAHCDRLEDLDGPLTAVLDGQQRLTALNIGLRGSLSLKLPGKWWTNASAFPKRYLYLNLLRPTDADDNGVKYQFDFLTVEDAGKQSDGACWFPVSDILSMQGGPAMVKWLNQRLTQDKVDDAYEVLDRLRCVVHSDRMIAFYEEQSQQLDKVLNIFIRLNSGGTVLSYSDLLLSIAVAQWSKYDAREEIQATVSEMNETGEGFEFSKDLVLKAGLMLSDLQSVGFRVDNFNKENMKVLEDNWPGIRKALLLAVQLVSSYGFTGASLRADSAILPIAYYLYRTEPGEAFLTHPSFETDRSSIRGWLIRSLLKTSGIWGSGLDTLLTALRGVIRDQKGKTFPYGAILEVMRSRSKSISFTPEEVEELVDMTYGDKRLFPLLTLLFPFVKQGYTVHIDHVYPKALFHRRRLEKAGVSAENVEEYQRQADTLPNLQLLLGVINNQKRAQHPLEWLQLQFGSEEERSSYRQQHHLGDMSVEMKDFPVFHAARRAALRTRLSQVLGVPLLHVSAAAE